MKNPEIKISVLMTVYNDAEYLPYSIRSILNQTYRDFEFIIVNDGSSDNTENIISEFKDERIKYKKISHSGLAAALNFGINSASGNWIARIDADDVNTLNRLQTQFDLIKSNPDYDVISSRSVYFEEPSKILFFLNVPEDDSEIKKYLNLHNPVNHSSVIYKKNIIQEAGGYNEKMECFEDFELWFRLKNKLTFKIIPEYLVYTRFRHDSMSRSAKSSNIYKMLMNNARDNLSISGKAEESNYWHNIIFWTEYFYGDKNKSRTLLTNNFTFRKALAFLKTYLPDYSFEKLKDLRIRYRMESVFKGKKKYEEELKLLLK